MNSAETVFFPLGPLDIAGETWHAILLCGVDGDVTPYWGQSWDAAIEAAEAAAGTDHWITLSWLEMRSDKAKGKGQMISGAMVPGLAWALANHGDPEGMTGHITKATALQMMEAMGGVAVNRRNMPEGQSRPFQIEFLKGELADRYTGAYDLSGGTVTVILTTTPANLRSIYETGFGKDLPEDVQFILAQIIDDRQGPIGHAMGALFGGGFKPLLRARLEGGQAGPCYEHEAQLMTMTMMRIPGLVKGSTFESGQITLGGTVHEVDMFPIELDA